nr:olfactory receptor 14A16-like [Pelodiscus sinensis]|eukprot:XP_006132722.1 olfactory receptor 14A16-like [Pelodiscus sinensis]
MSNGSTATEFLLLGFSDVRELQILHFVLFLVLYLAALVGNLLLISAVTVNRQLHTPMYFFLGNLAVLDLGAISVTVPKSMANSILNTRSISYVGCITQVFLFVFFNSADITLLTVMAYDRYVAICQPLHYQSIMNQKACAHMAAGAWINGMLNSAMHTGNTFAITFCESHVVDHFFCEIPQLLKLSCSDAYVGETVAIVLSAFLVLCCFVLITVSYVLIFQTVQRIPSEQGRHKAFSTCLPHLAVISLFIFPGTIAYLKPTSSSTFGLDLVVATVYALLPPVMNPVIYSMRNMEIKAVLWKMLGSRLFSKNKKPT